MHLDVRRPPHLLLHRRQALRPGPADGGLRARRAQRPQRLDPADPLVRPPRLRTCWRSTCPAIAAAPARRWPAWRTCADFLVALLDAAGVDTGRAGRPQLRFADRAGYGAARRSACRTWRWWHRRADGGVARAAATAREPPGARSTWSTRFRISPDAQPRHPGPGHLGARRLARADAAGAGGQPRRSTCSTPGFAACDAYRSGEDAAARCAARCCSCSARRTR